MKQRKTESRETAETIVSIQRKNRLGHREDTLSLEDGRFLHAAHRNGRLVAENRIDAESVDPLAAARSCPALHLIGAGTTLMEVHPSIHDDYLAIISARPTEVDAKQPFVTDDRYVDEDWQYEDEWIIDNVQHPESCWIEPVHLRINGMRFAALRSRRRRAWIAFDGSADDLRLSTTTDYITWGFYGESGGPCTFDGGAVLGVSGSGVLALNQWGDYNPQIFARFHPPESGLARDLVNWIRGLDWELPFLRSVVGFPGLSTTEQAEIWENDYIEGTEISTKLPPGVAMTIVRSLTRESPVLRAAVHALQHPRSERGKSVYGWTRLLATENWGASSWGHVDRALIGDIDPPDVDVISRTMSDILQDRLDKAFAEIHGWAGSTIIDSEIVTVLRSLASDDFDIQRVRSQFEKEVAHESSIAQRQTLARRLLDVAEDASGSQIWTAYKRKSEAAAESEWEFFDAYHVLHDPPEPRSGAIAEKLKGMLVIQEDATEAGWPQTWDPRIFPIWKTCGGSIESARAWAARGWKPEVVLGEGQLQLPWNLPVSKRVKELNPPNVPT